MEGTRNSLEWSPQRIGGIRYSEKKKRFYRTKTLTTFLELTPSKKSCWSLFTFASLNTGHNIPIIFLCFRISIVLLVWEQFSIVVDNKDYKGFSSLSSVIGQAHSRRILNQSDVKLTPIETWSFAFSRPSDNLVGILLAFILSSHKLPDDNFLCSD